jgi:hypothetical protein
MIRRVIAFAVIAMAHAVALQAQQSPAAQQAAAPQPGTDIWHDRYRTTDQRHESPWLRQPAFIHARRKRFPVHPQRADFAAGFGGPGAN